MAQQYVIGTSRYNDGKYIPLLERVFHGESPLFIREEGEWTVYEMPSEPVTFDQKWAVGSPLEGMIESGKMQPQTSILEVIEVQDSQESGLVLAATNPFGTKIQVKALLPGSDEWEDFPMFASREEAYAYIARHHPDHHIVSWQELYIEYRARVAASGFSFEDRARLMR